MNELDTNSSPPPLDRKSAILAAALAVFSEKGIEASTIDDIRQKSQSSVGSIYHHFGTKENIAAALFLQGLDDYWTRLIANASAQDTAEQLIHSLLETHIIWVKSNPDLARFLFARRQAVTAQHEATVKQFTNERFRTLLALFKPWFKQGVLRKLPAELYIPILMGPAHEFSRQWLSGRTQLEPLAVIEELSRAAWRSLATDNQELT